MKDRIIGAVLIIIGILLAIIYTLGSIIDLLFNTIWKNPDWDLWIRFFDIDILNWKFFVVMALWVLVIITSIIAIWIGYSMIMTPAPVPLEEELSFEETKEFEQSEKEV